MTLILTRSDVQTLIGMPEVIDAVRRAHADLARGLAALPTPPVMRLPGSPAAFVPMAAASATAGLASVKLLTDLPGAQRSTILAVSAADGGCAAVVDGSTVTRFRTAAATAVATAALARPDSRTLGLIGAGALAHAHLAALRAVLAIERVVVWSRNPATARAFAAATGADVMPDPEKVIAASDVVCTLTPSREPLVRGAWFHEGLHVNAVGAPPRPDHREIDSEGIARSRVIVDSRSSALHESGDVVIPLAEGVVERSHVSDELGEVLVGTRPGRTSREQITLFNSMGVGLQDLATVRLLIDSALERGVGTRVDLTQ
ncbi:ornithine cyclodeaminase family protein [Nonomuraea soli]|uniref:Ornithine cyclodeaminase/alanine dehydrogenase n=1 Tax=Nonomuraea soli TaxID=1032476 RepID=A0A7W0CI40_9ACTN|nr:Gfo/Idh/MocA family oxidoreductase [Nonomuraea soli]MBA2891541.1 ornithine cyclodeaminase/alanine dehydrogenase [Nonomuraea soli]